MKDTTEAPTEAPVAEPAAQAAEPDPFAVIEKLNAENAELKDRQTIMQLVEVFRGRIVDMSDKTFVIELTGGNEKIDAFEKLIEPYGVKELVRTGRIAMSRGARAL